MKNLLDFVCQFVCHYVDDDFEFVDFAENIEPNDLAPSERADNIALINRRDLRAEIVFFLVL